MKKKERIKQLEAQVTRLQERVNQLTDLLTEINRLSGSYPVKESVRQSEIDYIEMSLGDAWK